MLPEQIRRKFDTFLLQESQELRANAAGLEMADSVPVAVNA
jgi:hypothetical protein